MSFIGKKKRTKGPFGFLFPLLVEGHLAALGAIFGNFHLHGMGFLITGSDVVFFTAFSAFEDDFVTFAGHS